MASDAPFAVEIERESVEGLSRAMGRFRTELGKTQRAALHMGKRMVLRSLAADTRVAKKYRDYRDTGEVSRSGLNRKFIVRTKYQRPKRKGKDLRRSWQGPWRDQAIWAKNVRELKQRRAVIIAMRGLAKESWKALGARGRVRVKGFDQPSRNKRIMKKAARRWVVYRQNMAGNKPYVMLSNHLRYITQALKSGSYSVNNAIRNAGRAMEGMTDRMLAQAAAQNGFA